MSKKINSCASFALGIGSVLSIQPTVSLVETARRDNYYWAKQSWQDAGKHLHKAIGKVRRDAKEAN